MTSQFSCHLANRGVIALGGADRRGFLQGLISNDIELCTPDEVIYAALLTPQGKFLHDLFIVDLGEEFFIDCEAARAEDLLKRLAAYKLRAKVTFRDLREEYEVWAFRGEDGGLMKEIAYGDPRLVELSMRAMARKKSQAGMSARKDFSVYERQRLALGVPDGSRDMIVEKSTLTDGNFDWLNGISWKKGCYVGQELTARMHYRALVKKRMFPVKIKGPAPAFGATVTLRGEEIGDMRSSSGDLGIALLRIEKAELAMKENAMLACGESGLRVDKPDWMSFAAGKKDLPV